MYNDKSSPYTIFENREDAAKLLADKLRVIIIKKLERSISKRKGREEEVAKYASKQLLVLAIPRGGVITGDIIASSLGAKLDVVVSRKIGAPFNPGASNRSCNS